MASKAAMVAKEARVAKAGRKEKARGAGKHRSKRRETVSSSVLKSNTIHHSQTLSLFDFSISDELNLTKSKSIEFNISISLYEFL